MIKSKHLIQSMQSIFVVDGVWGHWGAWTSCSKSCAGGEKIRIRECDNPAPEHGGDICSGTEQDNSTCNKQPCPGNKSYLFIDLTAAS